MIKVLHVYRTFFPDTQGGLEEAILQITKNTSKLGVESKVFTISKKIKKIDTIQFEGIEVIRVPELFELASCNISFKGRKEFKQLAAWADVVNFHFPWPFADILNFLVPKRTKRVVTYHSDIVRQKMLLKIYRPLKRNFLGTADCIVSTSPNYFESSPVLQRYKKKVSVIPIGIDQNPNVKLLPSKLDDWKSKVGDGFFFFVGVLRYYKGLHILLDACANSSFQVVIAGIGPEEASLKAQAERLNLHNVTFLGFISDQDKLALMTLCKGIVFPSHLRSEAFGITLLEGAMASKPLITADIGSGMSYVNEDGVTGIHVKASDPISLKRAIYLIDSDQELADKMGYEVRRRYERLFTAEHMGKSYVQLYKKLVGK